MLPDLPDFEPVVVPLWLYVTTCAILITAIFYGLLDWSNAAKTENEHGTPPEPPRSRR